MFELIIKYLRKRVTPATSHEISRGSGVNWNTVRRILGEHRGNPFKQYDKRVCKVSGNECLTYHL